LGLDEAYIAQSEFNKALVKGIFGVFAPRGDGGHEPSSTRGASGGLHVITQTQRVHEQLGRVPTMQGGGRLFLMAALLTGFAIALYATFISSEYSLALATGTLTATLVGIGFLLRTGNEEPASVRHHSSEIQKSSGMAIKASVKEALPDPLAHEVDMPL
jgi:hypothetical protein